MLLHVLWTLVQDHPDDCPAFSVTGVLVYVLLYQPTWLI